MNSFQSLWAIANHLGLDPAALFTKASERLIEDAGSKVAETVGRRIAGSLRAIVSHWAERTNDGFQEYLHQRLEEVDEDQRTVIIEVAFAEWARAHTDDVEQLSRLLFRIVYLRALVDYCSDLPLLGGTEIRLDLENVWVPQSFRTMRGERTRQHHIDDGRFDSLGDVVTSCSAPLVVIGNSGVGKSTQLRKLVLDQSRKQLETTDFQELITDPLPVLIRAETLTQEKADFTTSITHAAARELALRLPFPIPENFLDPRHAGAPKSLFVVIDGLDEVPSETREDLVASIRKHAVTVHIVLASRLGLDWSGFTQVEVEEPTPEQANTLIAKLTLNSDRLQRISSIGLPRSPLILTLAALLRHQRISSRAALYREFVIDRLGRSAEMALRGQIGFDLLQACARERGNLAELAEQLTGELGLLPDGLLGLARRRKARDLLISTGIIRPIGE